MNGLRALIFTVLAVALGTGTAPAQYTRPPGAAQPAPPPETSGTLRLYLTTLHRKIAERWEGRAKEGRQPVITFEIGRDGQVSNMSVKESSGNRHYDSTAMRTITDSAPFPPLPDDYPGAVLRVHLGFNFKQ